MNMPRKPSVKHQDVQLILRWARDSAKGRLKLVERKEILPADEFAEAMEISRESLGKLVDTRRLFVLEVAGEIYYPAFYLQQDIDRKKLERVSRALGDISGWSKWWFFTTPKGSLSDKTPLQALKKEESLEAVVSSAIGFAER